MFVYKIYRLLQKAPEKVEIRSALGVTIRRIVDLCFQERRQRSFDFPFVSRFALPNDQDSPIQSSEIYDLSSISLFVLLEFLLPEIRSGLGNRRSGAIWMLVPEAAVNEDCLFSPRENDIGLAG